MASRWDPFRDLMSIQNELNRLFGRTYGGGEESSPTASGSSWMPPIDVYETNDKFVVAVELAGVSPDEVELAVEDSTLFVRGERAFSYQDASGDDAFHRVERRYGPFARSLALPATANADAIEASFDRGVLTIQVPKMEEAKPKRITIKASE